MSFRNLKFSKKPTKNLTNIKSDLINKIKVLSYNTITYMSYLLNEVIIAQCSKWYEISDMEIFQITEENPDPPTNQGAYFDILLSI